MLIVLGENYAMDDWNYSNKDNCMVRVSDDTTDFPPLPRMKPKSLSAAKTITIKIKREALTTARNPKHTYDTKC